MKYLFKAISTNTRDLRTGLLVIMDESNYLFNIPDGFQRLGLLSSTRVYAKNQGKYLFISNLGAGYFGGFPGFYLSARLSLQSDNIRKHLSFYFTILGPQGLR